MTAKLAEARQDRRYRAALPVFAGNVFGATRDMSTSGVYFWKDGMCMWKLGQSISFEVEVKTAPERTMWKCQGSIIRIEPLGDMVGVAIRLTDSKMERPWTDVVRSDVARAY